MEKKLLRRAPNALQMVMERLEELFKRMLVENRQCFDPEHMLVSSIAINAGSEVSLGDESFEDSPCRYGVTRNSRGIHH